MSNVHENWHAVSEAVVEQVKRNCGCIGNEKLRAIPREHFHMVFKTSPPPDKVVWRKEVLGTVVVYTDKSKYVFTDPDGSNACDFEGEYIMGS